MYLKTALSHHKYSFELYDHFASNTAATRKTAFWSMYYGCVMYMVSICCSFFYGLPDELAVVIASVMIGGVFGMVWHTQHMIDEAGVIFMPDEKLESMFDKQNHMERRSNLEP